MNYSEATNYLDSFINHERQTSYDYCGSFKLERMARLAALLGDPQKGIKAFHVAGSKGKGSTSAFIYSILKESGYKVGLYTSPHLLSFRERIRINDSLISETDIARLTAKARTAIDRFSGEGVPTFFEVYTALAFMYFKENEVDFAVYEVGLGGRLDATNIIEPVVSVITPISYEHTDKLGSTLREIASEKAGIVKRGVPCVSAPQEPEALEAIEKICKDRSSKLTLAGRDIKFNELKASEDGEVFSVSGIGGEYGDLRTSLIGSHQVMNAATAIAAVEVLNPSCRGTLQCAPAANDARHAAVRNGIASARWDGRLQVISKKPLIVLDGAQNRASARVLKDSVESVFKYNKLILVLGVSKDKDISGIVDELLPIADHVVLTKSSVKDRSAEPAAIRDVIAGVGANGRSPLQGDRIVLTKTVDDAISIAKSKATPDDMILVTGSLFVVGDALKTQNSNVKS